MQSEIAFVSGGRQMDWFLAASNLRFLSYTIQCMSHRNCFDQRNFVQYVVASIAIATINVSSSFDDLTAA